jgi:hypothetical protein
VGVPPLEKREPGFRTLLTTLWKYAWKVDTGLRVHISLKAMQKNLRGVHLTEDSSFVLGTRVWKAPIQLERSRW